MSVYEVINKFSKIDVQNNAGRDISIHHHHPPRSPEPPSGPIEFHFSEPTKTFAGRHGELQQLTEWFFEQRKEMVVICGCPGYGKTELGRQFVRQSKDNNNITHILWMEAETTDKLMNSFRDLAKLLRLPELDDQSLVKRVYQHFEGSGCVIVFDNAMCRRDLAQFEPSGRCLCLVTSHVKDWGDDAESLPLAPLSVREALDVLRAVLQHRFNSEHTQLYEELVEVVSCVPLALQIAAAYLRQEMNDLDDDFNLSDHLQHVKQSYEEIVDKPIPDSSSNTYDKSVAQAIYVSLRKLNNINNYNSKLALNILHACAYLYPERIPYSDLLQMSHLEELLADSENPSKDFKRACSLLGNYCFISNVAKIISIHRLVQHTLIFQQKYFVAENNNPFYSSCLELLLTDRDSSHRDFILQHSEKYVGTFRNFYSRYKSDIVSKFPFIHNLMVAGCEVYLKTIFDELKDDAADVINTFYLLHTAVLYGKTEVLNLLFKNGVEVDKQTENKETALYLAAGMLDLRAVQILTFHKADINKTDAQGFSILHGVVGALREPTNLGRAEEACEVLRWLADQGARTDAVDRFNWTLLHVAAYVLSAELVRFLVREFRQSVDAVNIYEQTSLHLISLDLKREDKEARLKTAECLLECGASLDVVNSSGSTPAQYARQQGHEYLARYLESPSKGYDIDQLSESDFNILRNLVVEGQVSLLKQKLEELGDCAAEKIKDHCLLHEAVNNWKHDVLELLLDFGADINSRNYVNRTALYVAASDLNLQAMQLLMSRGADVNVAGAEGWLVLHAFICTSAGQYHRKQHIEAGEYDMLKELIGRTEVVNMKDKSLLHFTAAFMHTEFIDYLVRELQHNVHALDLLGQTPLFYITYGLMRLVQEEAGIKSAECLVKHGARLDVVNNFGLTPAEHARAKGFKDLATYLEDTEAHQNFEAVEFLKNLVAAGDTTHLSKKLDEFEEHAAQKINEYNLLHVAAKHGQHSVLELLLSLGADVNTADDRGMSALHVAARESDLRAAELLVQQQADVRAASAAGLTVLHAAALSGRSEACEVVRWLVELGADPLAVTRLGASLLHAAAAVLDAGLARRLVRAHGLSARARDAAGQTPLYYVARGLAAGRGGGARGGAMARCLLDLGADPGHLDVDGFTAAMDARVWGYEDLAAVLALPQETQAGVAAPRWGWNRACVGVACAAAAAAAMQIYRNS